MTDFEDYRRKKLVSNITGLLDNDRLHGQPEAADARMMPDLRVRTSAKGSSLRERMRGMSTSLPRKEGPQSATCTAAPIATTKSSSGLVNASELCTSLSRPSDSQAGAKRPAPLPTPEEMLWSRKVRKLGLLSQQESLTPTEASEPPVSEPEAAAEPSSAPGILKLASVGNPIAYTVEDMDNEEDLFNSPKKVQAAHKSLPAKARKQMRGRGTSGKKLTEPTPGQQQSAEKQDEDDSRPEKCGGDVAVDHPLPISPAAAQIVAEEFRARPNPATAIEKGADEPLELRSTAPDAELHLQVPGSINCYLRDYQRQGVQFLFRQYSRNIGGILADDMGLGKTVQTIAFCAALLGKTGTQQDTVTRPSVAGKKRFPILIVAPSSVLDNWGREFQTWGLFSTCMFSEKLKASAVSGLLSGRHEIMLVSFNTYRLNHEDLHKLPWHVVIVDEAHKLKNCDSKVYLAAAEIKTKLRYGLTGTVMQNSYEELWNVLDYVVPNCLGSRPEFMHFYAKPLKQARQISASDYVLTKGQQRQKRLHELLQKYVLRRRKDNTIKDQMPDKVDNIVFCELTELQLRAYRRTLQSPDFQSLGGFLGPCGCGSGRPAGQCCDPDPDVTQGVLWKQFHTCECDHPYDPVERPEGCKWHKPFGCEGRLKCPLCLILPALTILRKISNHLELIKADPEECGQDLPRLERQEDVALMVLGADADELGGLRAGRSFLGQTDVRACGKLLVLDKLLDLWSLPGTDNKVLVFSHSTKMLSILEAVVLRKGHTYLRLDGSTPREDRQRMVDDFNNTPSLFLFLISTLAGGVGLNLASANKVVVMDPSWNPASDLQAIDRAYRLGQKRDVNVYRLITTGTLEELVYTRQLYKQQQSNVAVENAQERRYFEAVQKERGSDLEVKGELFGLQNLLRFSVDCLDSLENLRARRHATSNYCIEQYNPEDLADMDLRPGVTANGEAGTTGEDGGLRDLASQMARAATGAEADSAAEAAALMEAGVVDTLRHDQLLGLQKQQKQGVVKSETPGKKGKAASRLQELDTQPVSPVATEPSGTDRAANVLAGLAAWKQVSALEMARRLYSMSEEERTGLCGAYASSLA